MKPFVLFGAMALLVGSANAGTVNLQISLANSLLAGLPGATGGWIADLSDPLDQAAGDSILITGSSFDVPCMGCIPPPASTGMYTDLVGAGFMVLAPLGNCCGDPQSLLGGSIGSFAISPLAAPGLTSGFLEIDYSIFSVDPNDPTFNPNTDTVAADVQAFAGVTVDVVPEPGTGLLLSLAGICAALASATLRKRSRGSDR